MRNLKIFGLAFVAVLAMSAVAVSAASADDKRTAEVYPTTLTGGPDPGAAADLFVTTAGNVTCPNPTYDATVAGPTTTIEISPNYGLGCKALGFPATIDVNGCTYLVHLTAGTTTEGTVDIKCPAGKEITVTANPAEAPHNLTPKCVIHVKEQLGLGTLKITNVGVATTRELTLDINIEKIHYTHTSGAGLGTGLGACTAGTGTTGTLTAKATVTGEKTVE